MIGGLAGNLAHMPNDLDDLWGASLTDVHLDPVGPRVTLSLRVLDAGRETLHRLVLFDVTDIRFRNAIPGRWEYADVTEIRSKPIGGGRSVLEMMLWSEDAGLTIEFGSLTRE